MAADTQILMYAGRQRRRWRRAVLLSIGLVTIGTFSRHLAVRAWHHWQVLNRQRRCLAAGVSAGPVKPFSVFGPNHPVALDAFLADVSPAPSTGTMARREEATTLFVGQLQNIHGTRIVVVEHDESYNCDNTMTCTMPHFIAHVIEPATVLHGPKELAIQAFEATDSRHPTDDIYTAGCDFDAGAIDPLFPNRLTIPYTSNGFGEHANHLLTVELGDGDQVKFFESGTVIWKPYNCVSFIDSTEDPVGS